MESSRQALSNDMAEHRPILKNNQNTYYLRLSFTPKIGIAFPENLVFCDAVYYIPYPVAQILTVQIPKFLVLNIYVKMLTFQIPTVNLSTVQGAIFLFWHFSDKLPVSTGERRKQGPLSVRIPSFSWYLSWTFRHLKRRQ